LRRARDVVVVIDPDILGGSPVFWGTRVPVHLVATLLWEGSSEGDVLEGYPRVTAEMARLAPRLRDGVPASGTASREALA
jgi:uncharacterized protein (DUF433 family)